TGVQTCALPISSRDEVAMTPAERDRVRGKLLDVRRATQDALELIRRVIGPPALHPNEFSATLVLALAKITIAKRWELVEHTFPDLDGVRFEDLYVVLRAISRLVGVMVGMRFGEFSPDRAEAEIDEAIRVLERARDHIPEGERGPIDGMLDRLRQMRTLVRQARRIPARPPWLRRRLLRMLWRALFQRARGLPMRLDLWLEGLGEANGIPDLGGILSDLLAIDVLVDGIEIPPE